MDKKREKEFQTLWEKVYLTRSCAASWVFYEPEILATLNYAVFSLVLNFWDYKKLHNKTMEFVNLMCKKEKYSPPSYVIDTKPSC